MNKGLNKQGWLWSALAAWMLLFVMATPCLAQEDRLDRMEKELNEIKQDVKAIRQLLTELSQGQAGHQLQEVSIGDEPFRGDPKAKVTIIEFSDYQCPYCGNFFRQTLPQIDQEFIQTGKVRFFIRNLPLTALHPNAEKAAEAAECAGLQDKFWFMHDKLFQNQHALDVSHLKKYAEEIGLDSRAFDDCLDTGKEVANVQKDLQVAQSLGMNSTPSFFLGLTTPGQTMQGIGIRGALPIDIFRQLINRLLSQPATQPAKPP